MSASPGTPVSMLGGVPRPEIQVVRRVALIGSPEKPSMRAALDRVEQWLAARAEVVFSQITFESRRVIGLQVDLLLVLGGDGTLISAVKSLGVHQVPVLGVNLGKLGFLTEFTIEQLEASGDFLFRGALPASRRIMLDVRIENGVESFQSPAVNDCVFQAGPPFRIMPLCVEADGEKLVRFRGDGLIIATPTGSTAHNLSAGGPIVEPTAPSVLLTPICPHALTFRPLVLDARREIDVRLATEASDGANVVIDGRILRTILPRDVVRIRRYPADFLLIRNPALGEWESLQRKLMWGTTPTET